MKEFFFKEIRELWKLACLIGIVFVGIIAISHSENQRFDIFFLQMAYFPIMTCSGGLLLGIVSGLSERIHKRWDFMAHRPASMEAIFWGKTLAGCALLTAATLIPGMGDLLYWQYIAPMYSYPTEVDAICRLAEINLLPPLYWDNAKGMLPDLLMGFAFLYSGMSAVFLGLRLRPLFVMSIPLVALILSYTASSFPKGCIFAASGLAISLLAAKSLFQTCGQPRFKSTTGFLCIATEMLLSILMLGGMAFSVIREGYFNLPLSNNLNNLLLTDEGDLAVQSRQYDRNEPTIRYVRLDGKAMKFDGDVQKNNDKWSVFQSGLNDQRDSFSIYRNPNNSYNLIIYDSNKNQFYIYSITEKIIIVWDSATFREAGTWGKNGFVPPEKGRAEPLDLGRPIRSDRSNNELIVALEKGILRYGRDGQAPQMLFTPQAGESILHFYNYESKGINQIDHDYTKYNHLMVTNQRVCWMDKNFNLLHVENWKPVSAGNTIRMFYIPESRQWILAQYPDSDFNPDFKREIHYVKLNENLEVLKQASVPFPNYVGNPLNGNRFTYLSIPKNAQAIGLGIPWYCYSFENFESLNLLTTGFNQEFTLSLLFKYVPTPLWVYSILGALLAGAMAGLVLAPIYALNSKQRLLWTLASLILSWPAVLTMLLMLEKPFKPICASCGKKRPVNRETCPHCSKPWPAPKSDQTEIFVDAAPAQI